MNILYVITNLTGDERAIYRSLIELGCKVVIIKDSFLDSRMYTEFDFVLFNHSHCLEELQKITSPKVFWCFDLMLDKKYACQGPRYRKLMSTRKRWVSHALDISELGFFTDGGVVDLFPEKTVRLTQGAQKVKLGRSNKKTQDILFAGTVTPDRIQLLDQIQIMFPGQLRIVSEPRVFGEEFANLVASSKIVIAPDTPIKPNYWSNRVYMVLGYGGFLLHPYIEELSDQYKDSVDIVFYKTRGELHEKIRYYLTHGKARAAISSKGMVTTRLRHTYKHRCQELLEHARDRLGVKI